MTKSSPLSSFETSRLHSFSFYDLLLPDGLRFFVDEQRRVTIAGPLGSQVICLKKLDPDSLCFFDRPGVSLGDQSLRLTTYDNSRKAGSLVKTIGQTLRGAIIGVTQGFLTYLEAHGIGYRFDLFDTPTPSGRQVLALKVGQSHELTYISRSDVRLFLLKPTTLCVYGMNQHHVTQVAAEIRRMKVPEPYKGKGIRGENEVIRLKEGKKK